jgi:hypothetical protein
MLQGYYLDTCASKSQQYLERRGVKALFFFGIFFKTQPKGWWKLD